MRSGLLPLLLCLSLAGCGAGPGSTCTTVPFLSIEPAASTVSSSAKAPANEQSFGSFLGVMAAAGTEGCAIPANIAKVYPSWTNPDPLHISISSAGDATNGTATCKGPTEGAVTLSAVAVSGSQTAKATAQLTCQ